MSVGVRVDELVRLAEPVPVWLDEAVPVGVDVGVRVDVSVGVSVLLLVLVAVTVAEALLVAVPVCELLLVAVGVTLAVLLLVTDAVGVGDASSHKSTLSTANALSSRLSKKFRTLNCRRWSPREEKDVERDIHGVCCAGSSLEFMENSTRLAPMLAVSKLTSNTRASSGNHSLSIVSNNTLKVREVSAPT